MIIPGSFQRTPIRDTKRPSQHTAILHTPSWLGFASARSFITSSPTTTPFNCNARTSFELHRRLVGFVVFPFLKLSLQIFDENLGGLPTQADTEARITGNYGCGSEKVDMGMGVDEVGPGTEEIVPSFTPPLYDPLQLTLK
ncbi:hypothetical protein CVT25_003757 [Psilocybe cyanescens]|uniref:Uncharacterized protein n=1 Tax=Psilocybe cyanescens TaxID=93625 RepID=A0A409XTL5_PSICY|nr:hypothetical protein CVT25_003757 [Psilocybe cyanescens]